MVQPAWRDAAVRIKANDFTLSECDRNKKTRPPPILNSIQSYVCKDKEEGGGGTHPIILLVLHQFSSNHSSMRRFKGPVTTLLSPISPASPSPTSHPLSQPHTHSHWSAHHFLQDHHGSFVTLLLDPQTAVPPPTAIRAPSPCKTATNQVNNSSRGPDLVVYCDVRQESREMLRLI